MRDVRPLSPPEVKRVRTAFALLERAMPREAEHAANVFFDYVRAPEVCGPEAIACTAGRLGRRLSFAISPLKRDIVDLAVTISHEARHWAFGMHDYYVVPHTCRDCSNPTERARDPIYRRDDVVRQAVATRFAMEQQARRAASRRRDASIGDALAAAAVVLVIGAAAVAIARS